MAVGAHEAPSKAPESASSELAHDVKVIKGWMVFFGILAVVGLVASLVLGIKMAQYLNQVAQQGNSTCQQASQLGTSC